MFVTSDEVRGGLLVAVISGGLRHPLSMRPTAQYLEALEAAGVGDIVWCVCERDAKLYERDRYPMLVYPDEWGYEYAKKHWTDIQLSEDAVMKGGLAGAGRVYACLEAEKRGYWGVLQLDDNIVMLSTPRGSKAGYDLVKEQGGLGLFADLLAAVTLSTNSRMTGAQLQSVITVERLVARAGFPYSLFIERVGAGRENWFGPLEGDIIQAFQYGTRADGATAAVMPMLRYMKRGDRVSTTGTANPGKEKGAAVDQSAGGFRSIYDHTRSVQLQRMFPEAAKILARSTHSNGRGDPRVFHQMSKLTNPLRVHDKELFGQVRTRLEELLVLFNTKWHEELALKVERRARRAVTL